MSRADAVTAPAERRVIADAAAWLVRLHGGDMNDAAQAELDNWRRQSPDHERAWQAAHELSRHFGAVPPGIGMTVLERRRNRRAAIRTLAALMAVAPAAWLAWRVESWREWSADHRTATGERRSTTLADGSMLMLNSATAVDVRFDSGHRRVVLHEGEVLIETSQDAERPTRPFVVQTPNGVVQALGTRFSVRQTGRGEATQVAVFEHGVLLQPESGAAVTVRAGEQAAFTRDRALPPEALAPGRDAWSQGLLIADRQRLGDFLAELGRYRRGVLRCDPAVADLRISGVFELDDTGRALSIIQETLPVSVSHRTRYWVVVGPRAPR